MHENKYIKLSHFRCHVSQLTMCVPQSSAAARARRAFESPIRSKQCSLLRFQLMDLRLFIVFC